MAYRFKLDGKRATLDTKNERVVVYEKEYGRYGQTVVAVGYIPGKEQAIAYTAACLFIVANIDDPFYERNFGDMEARWLDYAQERNAGKTREEVKAAMDAMRARMSDLSRKL